MLLFFAKCIFQIPDFRKNSALPVTNRTFRFGYSGSVNLYAQKSKQAAKEKSRYAMEESPRATSRCFMFMYFLLPH